MNDESLQDAEEIARLEEIRRQAQDDLDLARENLKRAEARKAQAMKAFAEANTAVNVAHAARAR